MTKLIATRGLPGSGKSTWSRAYAASVLLVEGRHIAVLSRDLFRDALGITEHGDFAGEAAVTVAIEAAVNALLSEGVDVVLDAVHLRARDLRKAADLAAAAGAEFGVHDFTDVPLETCLERNATRPARTPLRCDGASVPEEAIRRMYERFLQGRKLPLPIPEATVSAAVLYVPPEGKPDAIMVDIDGTVAELNGRSPYDESTVGDDLPNEPVIDVVRLAAASGKRLVFMSGRTDGCRQATEAWLDKHVLPHPNLTGPIVLHMRASGDTRPDNVVKLELFDKHVRDHYRVRFVLDDRDSVVRAWRSIGLTVLQVAEGRF